MHEPVAKDATHDHNQYRNDIANEQIQKCFDKIAYDLTNILSTSARLRALARSEIKFQEPILTLNREPFIFPRAITVIQGATGTHKSRIGEGIAAVMLAQQPTDFVGIERVSTLSTEVIIMVDTERNLQDQLPYAIQQIKKLSGYDIETDPPKFEYISLLDTPRKDRFHAVEAFLTLMQHKYKTPMFVILDVVTDCVEDFNRVDNTMTLIDSMNRFINRFDTTFLCVIHENPGSEKARGHLGTEISNKASTIMKIGFETFSGQVSPDILNLKILKVRAAKRPASIYLKYVKDIESLVAADAADVDGINDSGKKAHLNQVVPLIESLFTEDCKRLTKTDLYSAIINKFHVSSRLIDDRIIELISTETIIKDFSGTDCILYKKQDGRSMFFELQPLT